jgi:hypothetical protein
MTAIAPIAASELGLLLEMRCIGDVGLSIVIPKPFDH